MTRRSGRTQLREKVALAEACTPCCAASTYLSDSGGSSVERAFERGLHSRSRWSTRESRGRTFGLAAPFRPEQKPASAGRPKRQYRVEHRRNLFCSTEGVCLRLAVLAVLASGALVGTTAASARPPLIEQQDEPCGCNLVLVGWGHSTGGQEWVQRYGVRKQSRFLTLSLPAANGEDNGGEGSWNDGALSRIVFIASFGNGFAAPDSWEVSGAATADVHTIRFIFSAGPPLVVHPYMASSRLRHRFSFLRHIRFFLVFFSGREGTVKTATAYDGAGRELQRHRARRRR
jgi:hypothetical protein